MVRPMMVDAVAVAVARTGRFVGSLHSCPGMLNLEARARILESMSFSSRSAPSIAGIPSSINEAGPRRR